MATEIIDKLGNHFSIAPDQKITINGVEDSGTANVTLLLYWFEKVYQVNTSLDWWVYGGSPGAWTFTGHDAAGDPRNGPNGYLSQDITGLNPSTAYDVQVFAVNSGGSMSPASAVVSGSTTS